MDAYFYSLGMILQDAELHVLPWRGLRIIAKLLANEENQ